MKTTTLISIDNTSIYEIPNALVLRLELAKDAILSCEKQAVLLGNSPKFRSRLASLRLAFNDILSTIIRQYIPIHSTLTPKYQYTIL